METRNLATARWFLAALEAGAGSELLLRFYSPNVVQVELPNILNPKGGRSDLARLLQRAEQGRKLLRQQSYAVRSASAQGERVALEADWQGELAQSVGAWPAGTTMRAHLAMFLEFEDGRIVQQRNYDCFEPVVAPEPAPA